MRVNEKKRQLVHVPTKYDRLISISETFCAKKCAEKSSATDRSSFALTIFIFIHIYIHIHIYTYIYIFFFGSQRFCCDLPRLLSAQLPVPMKSCSVSLGLCFFPFCFFFSVFGIISCCYTSFPSEPFSNLYCCFSLPPMPHTCSSVKEQKRKKASEEHQLEVELLVILASTKTTYKSEILFDALHLGQTVVTNTVRK